MWMRRICVAVALMVGLADAAQAEDVVLELKPIKSAAECRSSLGDFAWVCANFDDPDWRDYNLRLFGEDQGYWDRYSAAVAVADLDGDRKPDLILQIVSSLTCGMRNCDTHFMFSGISTEDMPVSYDISGPSRPASIHLRYNDRKTEIRFEAATKWFDVEAMKLEV
jgi:hypothetical protein